MPSLRDQFRQDALTSHQANRPRELLPSILAHSPPGRYSSLPPIQRSGKLHRPRKSSVGQNARKAKHERTKSREYSRRLSMEGRKAMSAEPPTAAWVQGKRWEDLIEAATSATEADDDRDLTPVSVRFLFRSIAFFSKLCCSVIGGMSPLLGTVDVPSFQFPEPKIFTDNAWRLRCLSHPTTNLPRVLKLSSAHHCPQAFDCRVRCSSNTRHLHCRTL